MSGICQRARGWTAVLRAATVIAVMAVGTALQGGYVDAVSEDSGVLAQTANVTNADPCRFLTAQEMGKAFGRSIAKSAKINNLCEYTATDRGVIVVRLSTAPLEAGVFLFAKTGLARGEKSVTKVPTPVGEAYFDAGLPCFVGRVGNQEVQIETTIEPLPREAMIAVGTRVMQALGGK